MHHTIHNKVMSKHCKENAWEIIVSLISPCDVTDDESALPTGQMKALKWQPSAAHGFASWDLRSNTQCEYNSILYMLICYRGNKHLQKSLVWFLWMLNHNKTKH